MYTTVIFVAVIHLLFYDFYETRLIWKNDIRIRPNDFEDDLERIPSILLKSLNLLVEKSKMERFYSLADSQPEVRDEYREIEFQEYDYQVDYGQMDPSKNQSKKRFAEEKSDYDATEKTFINGTEKEIDYNLDEFKNEYDSKVPWQPEIAPVQSPGNNLSTVQVEDDGQFHVTKTIEYSMSCLKMPLWKFLFFGVYCVFYEIAHITNTGKILNIFILTVKTVITVLPSIFLVFLCLWCYNGMCSCFFPHEFFHPYREIIKIKSEAYRIPPGVYIDENGEEFTYTPSEAEVRVYQELMDLIRS